MNTKYLLSLCLLLGMALAACSTPAAPKFAAAAPTAAAAPAAATAAPAAPAVGTSGPGGASQLAYAPAGGGMVIKDAELELLVRDTDVAMAQITQMTADYNGYIISSQTWYQDGFKYASVRLGLPSATFEKSLNYLRDVGLRVIKENASGQDVSAEYVDLQSKLTNLEATAARVREFLKDAKTVEESLRISQQLAELEAQIEQVKGQMRFYEGRAAFSTVTVKLQPQYPTPTPTNTPIPASTPTPTPGWNPGRTFNQASGVVVNATQATIDVLIWVFVVVGPIALVLIVIYGGARRLGRKRA